MAFCGNCGKQLPEGAAFCTECGKPVAPVIVMLICWCAVRVIVLMTIGKAYHSILLTCWIYPITWGLSSVVYIVFLKLIKRKGVF